MVLVGEQIGRLSEEKVEDEGLVDLVDLFEEGFVLGEGMEKKGIFLNVE